MFVLPAEENPVDPHRLLNAFPEEFVALSRQEQALSIHLYRLLAQGAPVTHARLAAAAAIPVAEVDRLLAQWLGVYHDDAGRVTGYLGLGLSETRHQMRVDGRELYAWCAWDTLFLPMLMGRSAQVISHCAQTGAEIRFEIDAEGIVTGPFAPVRLSFVTPDQDGIRKDVINSFCQSVLFFATAEAGGSWLSGHPDAFLLSLRDAARLAQRFVRRKYPGLMTAPACD